jgi:hypothetical protein
MKNPYLVALAWLTSGLAFVGFVFAGCGVSWKNDYGQPETDAASYLVAGLVLLGVAFLCLLFTLLLAGIRWAEPGSVSADADRH